MEDIKTLDKFNTMRVEEKMSVKQVPIKKTVEKPKGKKPIMLSPSSLSLFLECPRCFWLHFNKGVKRPSGPFPSLPGGMDRVLKEYFDSCRERGIIPTELNDEIKGKLFSDMEHLNIWRNSFKGLKFVDERTGAVLKGALDDLFVTSEGFYIPIDFKTRSSPPTERTLKTVQHQMDIYCFLLEQNGMKTADFACLIYYFPKKCEQFGSIKFNTELVKLRTDKGRGKRIFIEALKLLEGEEPESSSDCPFCKFREGR